MAGAASREVYGITIPSALDFFGVQKSFRNSLIELHSHVDKHIDAALLRRADSRKVNLEKAGAPQSVVFLDELVKETQDRNFIRDQLLNMFFPARDSSAIGASCIFFILARNPEVWKKLRAEVLGIEQPLTRTVLASLRYVNQVVKEGR